jgi:hypothetical protein
MDGNEGLIGGEVEAVSGGVPNHHDCLRSGATHTEERASNINAFTYLHTAHYIGKIDVLKEVKPTPSQRWKYVDADKVLAMLCLDVKVNRYTFRCLMCLVMF